MMLPMSDDDHKHPRDAARECLGYAHQPMPARKAGKNTKTRTQWTVVTPG